MEQMPILIEICRNEGKAKFVLATDHNHALELMKAFYDDYEIATPEKLPNWADSLEVDQPYYSGNSYTVIRDWPSGVALSPEIAPTVVAFFNAMNTE